MNKSLIDIIKEMEGRTNVGRRLFLYELLTKAKIPFEPHIYVRPEFKPEQYEPDENLRNDLKYKGYGANFILAHGTGLKQIIVTAHHDRVSDSPGANDNASGVAVCLGLHEMLKEYPVPNSTIKIIIFDDEEARKSRESGYGSRMYVEEEKKEKRIENISCVYSLECCGFGDMIGIWPVDKQLKEMLECEGNHPLQILTRTLTDQNIQYETAAEMSRFHSDDKSFRDAGVNNAYCIIAFPEEDLPILRGIASSDIKLFTSTHGLSKRSSLLKHYHNSNDTSDNLREDVLQRTVNIMYNTVVNLDKSLI